MKYWIFACTSAVLLFLIFTSTAKSDDGIFYWSLSPLEFVRDQDVKIYFDYNDYVEGTNLALYLYYQPGDKDIKDRLEINFEFDLEGFRIIDAELVNPDITISGFPLGKRWDKTGTVTIDGNQVFGLTAFNTSSLGGLQLSNTEYGAFTDEGYNNGSFLVAKVSAVFTKFSGELSVTAIDEGIELAPEVVNNEYELSCCVLTPPYNNYDASFELLPNLNFSCGSYHAAVPWPNTPEGAVWNRFIPPSDGIFTCDTFFSLIDDTQLEIYSGDSSESLSLIAFNDDAGGSLRSRTSFPVVEGETYSIKIVGGPMNYGLTGLEYYFLENALFGDINNDNSVDLLDISPFVEAITNQEYIPSADTNYDGEVDLLDVNSFVNLLASD
ncbi:MAG: hypothetical protein AAGA30_08120 [Planctomycetota bacterium]